MIAVSFLGQATTLGDLARERSETIRHMAADLAETGNWRDRGDAVRQLHADGYGVVEIMILVDEAIFECKQEEIALAMSDEGLNHLATADDSALNGHPATFVPHHQ